MMYASTGVIRGEPILRKGADKDELKLLRSVRVPALDDLRRRLSSSAHVSGSDVSATLGA